MCGILAVIGGHGLDVRSGLDSIIHRGPDFTDIVEESSVRMGHNRLAIIDLDDRSNQPFIKEEIAIVFNGEIYNYLALKEDLVKLGIKFLTDSDTEVILEAYRQWGTDAFNRFNGDWAFVIHDRLKNNVVVCRDRFGQKPLFVRESNNGLVFASELQAIVKIEKSEVSHRAICAFIAEGDSTTNQTFYENIKDFPVSSYRVLTEKGQLVREGKYWNYPEGKVEANFEDLSREFETTFFDAVKLRLVSDVGYCVLLSGGLDSSILVNTIKELNPQDKLESYCYSSNDADDESRYALELSRRLNYSNARVQLNYSSFDKFRDELKEIVKHLGKGHSSPAVVSVNKLYNCLSNNGFKVALDGQGADELLGGYEHFHIPGIIDGIRFGDFSLFKDSVIGLLINWRFSLPMFLRSKLSVKYRYALGKYVLPNYAVLSMKPHFIDFTPGNKVGLNSYLRKQHQKGLKNLLYYGDIIAMKNSVENRSPFMDHRLVEIMFSSKYKGFVKGNKSKPILRVFKSYDSIKDLVERKKVGFNTVFPNEFYISMVEELKLRDWSKIEGINYIRLNKTLSKYGTKMTNKRFIFRLYQAHLFLELNE